jgi:para-aminobenzoate synthetase component 1
MISTVSSTLLPSLGFGEIIEKTFPMGSMTGAPKIRCMELIDRYENFRRGWFSGAIGYLSNNEDFDFNVVIRSIIMDKGSGKLFFAVGSAITYDSDPQYEFSECMLKAKSIFEVLQGKGS